MNWDQLAGEWTQFKGRIKERWGQLTDDDLDVINGQRQQLVGVLQERYGIAKDIAEYEIKEFVEALQEDEDSRSGGSEKLRRAG